MHHTGCRYCGAPRAEHTAQAWAYCARQHALLQQTAPGCAVTAGPSCTLPASTTEKEQHPV